MSSKWRFSIKNVPGFVHVEKAGSPPGCSVHHPFSSSSLFLFSNMQWSDVLKAPSAPTEPILRSASRPSVDAEISSDHSAPAPAFLLLLSAPTQCSGFVSNSRTNLDFDVDFWPLEFFSWLLTRLFCFDSAVNLTRRVTFRRLDFYLIYFRLWTPLFLTWFWTFGCNSSLSFLLSTGFLWTEVTFSACFIWQ